MLLFKIVSIITPVLIVSHDRLEICWFDAQETFRIYKKKRKL